MALTHGELYKGLYFILNDVLPLTESVYIRSGLFSSELRIFYIILNDLIMFTEKKTNFGLFFLRVNLNILLYASGVDDISISKLLLTNLKVIYFNNDYTT